MRNHKRKKSVNRIPRSNKTSSLLLIEKASPETEKRGREREETAMVKSIFIKWSSINCTAHPSRRCLLLRLHRRRLCWDAHIFSYLFTFFWKKKNLFTRLEMYKMCVAMLDFFSFKLTVQNVLSLLLLLMLLQCMQNAEKRAHKISS